MPLFSNKSQRRCATRIDARTCDDNVGMPIEDVEEILGLALGALTDHQRQFDVSALDKRLKHGAVGGDDFDASVLLPQRKRLTLGDRDLQAVRIKLEHGRVGDPGIRHQACARRIGIEEQQRSAAGHAGRGQYFFAADFFLARQRNRRRCESPANSPPRRAHPWPIRSPRGDDLPRRRRSRARRRAAKPTRQYRRRAAAADARSLRASVRSSDKPRPATAEARTLVHAESQARQQRATPRR